MSSDIFKRYSKMRLLARALDDPKFAEIIKREGGPLIQGDLRALEQALSGDVAKLERFNQAELKELYKHSNKFKEFVNKSKDVEILEKYDLMPLRRRLTKAARGFYEEVRDTYGPRAVKNAFVQFGKEAVDYIKYDVLRLKKPKGKDKDKDENKDKEREGRRRRNYYYTKWVSERLVI
ncbi:MAG: hypothetical protein ACK4SY_06710 [Pyrobaculum sp.]